MGCGRIGTRCDDVSNRHGSCSRVAWVHAIDALRARDQHRESFGRLGEWGARLGVTDASATRAGLEHVTGDNLYLKYAVEMGLFGILFLVLTFGGIIGHAFNLFRNGSTDTQRRMGAIIWLATIGLAINGMTAVVFNAITLGWLFFWLAGAVVTVSQRVTIPEAALA